MPRINKTEEAIKELGYAVQDLKDKVFTPIIKLLTKILKAIT